MLAELNPAARLGPGLHKWWKDWRGQTAAIIASGPTAKNASIGLLRDKVRVIAIKESHDLCKWADAVYGCDQAWWKHRRGLGEYKGLKLSYARELSSHYLDIKFVDIPDKVCDKFLFDKPGLIGSGGNSGFQALNIAMQFGAGRIILIGYDMHDAGRVHWYGRNNWNGASNPMYSNYRRWTAAFAGQASRLEVMGIKVINASPNSELNCFQKMSIEQAIDSWKIGATTA